MGVREEGRTKHPCQVVRKKNLPPALSLLVGVSVDFGGDHGAQVGEEIREGLVGHQGADLAHKHGSARTHLLSLAWSAVEATLREKKRTEKEKRNY